MSTQLNILLGGAGLIGTALDRALTDRGEQIKVYDLKTGVDLREYEPEDFGADTYYWFLAWDVGGAKYIMDDSQQLAILRHNLDLCHKVFGWLEKRNAKYTFVSSQMVGYPNAYGVTKAIGETWTKLVGRGLITHLWNCYDAEKPTQRSHVIPDLLVQAKSGMIRLLTSGDERRQFLHADDVAKALILQRENGQPLADVTSGEWVSVLQVAEIIASEFGAKVVPGATTGYESMVEPSISLDDWQPTIELAVGLRMVIDRMVERGWL